MNYLLVCCFLFVTTSVKASVEDICEVKECKCFENGIECEKYKGDFSFKKIPDKYTSLHFSNSEFNKYEGSILTDGNKIENLTFFRCIVRKLDLTNFKLKELSVSFTEVFIEEWDIDGSQLKVLELKKNSLSFDQIAALKKFLSKTPYVEFLAITTNKFYNLTDDMFVSMKNLKTIELDDCLLENVPSFSSFTNLETMDLSDNALNSLPENFLENSHSLKNFQIGNNRISELSIDFCKFPSLVLVEFYKLNLKCDCKWLKGLNVSRVEPSNFNCSELIRSPTSNDTEIKYTLMEYKELQCASEVCPHVGAIDHKQNLSLVLGILIALVLIGIIILLVVAGVKYHKKEKPDPKQVKYRAVYKDTVENA